MRTHTTLDKIYSECHSLQLFNEPEITVETVGSNQTDSYGSKSDGSGKTTITNRSVMFVAMLLELLSEKQCMLSINLTVNYVTFRTITKSDCWAT